MKNVFRYCMLKLMENVQIFLHSRLKHHCSTRWIEDHDAVFVFKEFYSAVVDYLNQLSESRDGKVLGKAIF